MTDPQDRTDHATGQREPVAGRDRLRPNPPIPVAGVFGHQSAHHGQHWGIPHGQPSTGLLTGQGEHGLSHPTLEAVVVHELLEQFGIILDERRHDTSERLAVLNASIVLIYMPIRTGGRTIWRVRLSS